MNEIKLTKQEKALYQLILGQWNDENYDKRMQAFDSSFKLLHMLSHRKAIPTVRWKYFAEPIYNTGRGKMSHKQIFERNGTTGNDIYRHPHFIPYLRYFIEGPKIQEHVKSTILSLKEGQLYDDDLTNDIYKYLLKESIIPSDISVKNAFAEEVFKLAIELDIKFMYCKQLKNKIRQYR